jgi:hypothetical protein
VTARETGVQPPTSDSPQCGQTTVSSSTSPPQWGQRRSSMRRSDCTLRAGSWTDAPGASFRAKREPPATADARGA